MNESGGFWLPSRVSGNPRPAGPSTGHYAHIVARALRLDLHDVTYSGDYQRHHRRRQRRLVRNGRPGVPVDGSTAAGSVIHMMSPPRSRHPER